jgi:hypothetical protein
MRLNAWARFSKKRGPKRKIAEKSALAFIDSLVVMFLLHHKKGCDCIVISSQ